MSEAFHGGLIPAPSTGGCWPTPDQTLLLRACALEVPRAAEAWAAWRSGHSLEDADHVAISLFPPIYRRLGALLGAVDENALKGAYRSAWLRNQVLLKGAVDALETLHRAGIRTLLLKGAGLAVASYRDTGARPMEDVDILVPRADADRALTALVAAGWLTEPRRLRSEHAQAVYDGAGHVLDLHWFSLAQSGSDDGFWERSVEIEMHGMKTRALCPADQLLHVAAHGGEWGLIPPVRWMADAAAIDRSGSLDWEVFVAEAIARRMTVLLAAALEQLVGAVDLPVPTGVFALLDEAPKGRLERRVHRTSTQQNGGGEWWLVELERFRRRARLDPTLRLSDFLKDHFGVATRRELIAPVARKSGSVAWLQARRLVRR
jgi:hypothetical protein